MLSILLATTAEFSPSSGHCWVQTFLKSLLCLHILGSIIYEEYIKVLGRVRRKNGGNGRRKRGEGWRGEEKGGEGKSDGESSALHPVEVQVII